MHYRVWLQVELIDNEQEETLNVTEPHEGGDFENEEQATAAMNLLSYLGKILAKNPTAVNGMAKSESAD